MVKKEPGEIKIYRECVVVSGNMLDLNHNFTDPVFTGKARENSDVYQ